MENKSNEINEIIKEIEEKELEGLVISLIGSVNAGKSTTINKLLKMDDAEVSPIPGWTKDITPYKLTDNIYVVDTPGLNDINTTVSKNTEKYQKESDIILYFLNAATGLTKAEKEAFLKIRSLKRPYIVVLNKIDTLDNSSLNDLISYLEGELGTKKIIPISAKTEEGLEKLNEEIFNVLETEGKSILYAKITRNKEIIVKRWIKASAISAAGIGAIPIPGSDVIPLTGLQIALILKIAKTYGYKLTKESAAALLSSMATGMIGRTIFRELVKLVPGLGNAISASIAGAFTYGLGMAANEYFKRGMNLSLEEINKTFTKYFKVFRNFKEE